METCFGCTQNATHLNCEGCVSGFGETQEASARLANCPSFINDNGWLVCETSAFGTAPRIVSEHDVDSHPMLRRLQEPPPELEDEGANEVIEAAIRAETLPSSSGEEPDPTAHGIPPDPVPTVPAEVREELTAMEGGRTARKGAMEEL